VQHRGRQGCGKGRLVDGCLRDDGREALKEQAEGKRRGGRGFKGEAANREERGC
jgi:hypothetical protein